LDYGVEDKERAAGALRGCKFLPDTLLRSYSLTATDPFIKWLYDHAEKGAEPMADRIKPFFVRFYF
jgi:hypothetical protein